MFWAVPMQLGCPAAVCEIPPALGVNTGPNPQWNIDAKNTRRTHLVELPSICYCRISYLDDAFLHTPWNEPSLTSLLQTIRARY